MSLRTGLFDSTHIVQTVEGYPRGNKAETADFFAHYFYGMLGNGLDALVENNFKVEAQSGMTLTLNPGSAYIKGYHAFDEFQATITISASSSVRTLYIVLRLNTQDGEISLQYTDTFTRAGAVYDIALARLDIPGNTVEIIPAMITDLRTNANFCGFIRKITDENAEQLQEQINNIPNLLYPVGSIYLSVNNVNPGTLFPGQTWEPWGTGRVPVGVDGSQTDFNTVEKTGGSKDAVVVKHGHDFANGACHKPHLYAPRYTKRQPPARRPGQDNGL